MTNYNELKIGIENYIIKNENQISEFLSTNQTCEILNEKFLNSFIDNLNIKPIEVILSDQLISIKISNGKILKFKSNNNILDNNKKI